MFGGIGVAFVAVLIFVISLFYGGGKAINDFTLYLKDSEIFFFDLKKDSEAWQLTSGLVDTEDFDNEVLAVSAYVLGNYTCLNENVIPLLRHS